MKTCSACKESKLENEFNLNRAQKDGLDNQCTSCSRTSKAKWKKENRAKCNAQQRTVYAKNPAKGRARMQRYRILNPSIMAEQSARRHAAILQRTPNWLTEHNWRQIEMFYDAACRLTKELGIEFQVDHIMPLRGKSSSGLHVPWNLQVITADDNRRKGNKV